jgi:hypothetical protein
MPEKIKKDSRGILIGSKYVGIRANVVEDRVKTM